MNVSKNNLQNGISTPNPDNPHNYMLDTSAFNKLADSFKDVDLFIRSKSYGFMYFKTANQDYELGGMGAKVYDENCHPKHFKSSEALKAKQPLFKEIINALEIKRVSSVGSLMLNHWILDGTYREWDDHSREGEIMQKILQFNENLRKKRPFAQHYDAMIAESAMHNSCTLITNDSDLKNLVNESFPNRAIDYNEMISRINSILGHYSATEATHSSQK